MYRATCKYCSTLAGINACWHTVNMPPPPRSATPNLFQSLFWGEGQSCMYKYVHLQRFNFELFSHSIDWFLYILMSSVHVAAAQQLQAVVVHVVHHVAAPLPPGLYTHYFFSLGQFCPVWCYPQEYKIPW